LLPAQLAAIPGCRLMSTGSDQTSELGPVHTKNVRFPSYGRRRSSASSARLTTEKRDQPYLHFIAWLGVVVAFSACGTTSHETCNCPTGPAIGPIIDAPTGTVQSIGLSGNGCNGAQVFCADGSGAPVAFTPGCAEYVIVPKQDGTCEVTATLSGGSMEQQSVTMTSEPSCCGTMWKSEPASWLIGSADANSSDGPSE